MSLMMEGKTIVVAGVGTGLGSQVGRLGLREGANVVLAARSRDTLESIAALAASGALWTLVSLRDLPRLRRRGDARSHE